MAYNEHSLHSVELKLEVLNKKFDEMIGLFEKVQILLEKKKKPKQVETDTNWSVHDYKNSILVSFSFNREFKDYIKELGGVWMVSKKAWMFPKSNEEEIVEQIKTKFPKWNFVKEEI
jgi:pyruvate-formate lyase